MRMVGVVKKKGHNGQHMVLCQDISDVYGKDAQVAAEEEPEGGLSIGDRIAFDVDEPGEGFVGTPLARNVRIVESAGGAGTKRRSAEAAGDGEEDEEVLLDDGDGEDEGAVEDPPEEPDLDQEELEELEAEAQREIAAEKRRPAVASAPRKAAAAPPRKQPRTSLPDPQTPEEWAEVQDELFPGLAPLKKGWIRIRSKSKGLVYFYNIDSGESSAVEPLR